MIMISKDSKFSWDAGVILDHKGFKRTIGQISFL